MKTALKAASNTVTSQSKKIEFHTSLPEIYTVVTQYPSLLELAKQKIIKAEYV